MRRNIDPVEDAYLRSEAARLIAGSPFYRLSFFTCDDHSDALFIPPRIPADTPRRECRRATIEAGERMAQELIEVIADQGVQKHSTASFVIATVLLRCRDPLVLQGFGMALGRALVGCADMLHFVRLESRQDPRVTFSDPRNGLSVTACAKDGSLSRPRRAA